MSDSVLELIQGIFNTFLFVMSVVFSILLIDVVMQRSKSMDVVTDNRNIYEKVDAEDNAYTIKGSSIMDTICRLASNEDDIKVTVNGMSISEALLDGICIDGADAIYRFYELIDADKDYAVCFGYDGIKSLEITEEDDE